MTLYEINQALLDLVDPETGELADFEVYEQLQLAREEKVENTALLIKNLLAEAKMIEEEEKKLNARRRAAENKASRLKEYLINTLEGEQFSSPRVAIGFRKSAALEVHSLSSVVAWLTQNGHGDLVVHGMPSLDKRTVTELVKSGVEIPGCEVVNRSSLQVR